MGRVSVIGAIVIVASIATAANAQCGAVAHAEELLKPGARIIVGEIHGTTETPRVVGDLVCLSARKGPVRLAIEYSSEEQPAIDVFLASAGTPADRNALFRGKQWIAPTRQDGRHSVAMADLIDSVRKLRRSGADVDIVAFVTAKPAPDHELAMAQNLLAAFARAPKATFIVLTGNVHAERRPDESKRTLMAGRLLEGGAILSSLDSRYGSGTAWSCFSRQSNPSVIDPQQMLCGPAVIGSGPGAPPAVVLGPTGGGTYDGVLDVGAATFSPPAALPLTKEQQARAAGIGRQLEARRAYDAKAYARCAEAYAALARDDRAMDDAYNAACCYALAKNLDRAFEQLRVALDLGFKDADALQKDADLASLRSDARWKAFAARLAK